VKLMLLPAAFESHQGASIITGLANSDYLASVPQAHSDGQAPHLLDGSSIGVEDDFGGSVEIA